MKTKKISKKMPIMKISLNGSSQKWRQQRKSVNLKIDYQKLPNLKEEKRIKLKTQKRFIICLTGVPEEGKYSEVEKTSKKNNISKFPKFVKVTN